MLLRILVVQLDRLGLSGNYLALVEQNPVRIIVQFSKCENGVLTFIANFKLFKSIFAVFAAVILIIIFTCAYLNLHKAN